jgi:UDP-N-acetyl-D-galactosamine dehydrogenase
VDELYQTIITAGTHKAGSSKIAEAAKVIENTQRDINIALINELAMIFKKLGIDTEAVLEAAGTKWNFLPFRPGLVGGHCIGIDPYYLTHKAIEVGYHPEMILAGRRLNDNMGSYVVDQICKLMIKKRIQIVDANVLIMGLAFKENCPDLRNSRVVDLVSDFEEYHCHIDVYDPWVDKAEAKKEYGITLVSKPVIGRYDAIVLAVSHDQFKKITLDELQSFGKENHVLYDIKYLLRSDQVDGRL